MKKYTKLALLAAVLSVGVSNFASAYQNCDAKKQALEYQIKQAERYGNYNKVASLKRALANVENYCVSNGNSNVVDSKKEISKLENKIKSLQSDVKELQVDLKDAKRKNDTKKVNKLKSKIEDKKSDIKELKEKIKNLKK